MDRWLRSLCIKDLVAKTFGLVFLNSHKEAVFCFRMVRSCTVAQVFTRAEGAELRLWFRFYLFFIVFV